MSRLHTNFNTQKSFNFAISPFLVFGIGFLMQVYALRFHSDTAFFGLALFVTVALSAVGFAYALQSLEEKNTAKKTIGLVINTRFILAFVIIIGNNISDMYKILNPNKPTPGVRKDRKMPTR